MSHKNNNKNSHPALKIFKYWVPQFCIFNFDFCILKLTNQFESIMQNKPNFQKAEMKLSFYSTGGYENQGLLRNSKNKPNQTQFQKVYSLRADRAC